MSIISAPHVCSRCVLDSSVPATAFGEDGVCSHCDLFERLGKRYPLDEQSPVRLERLVAKIKSRGRRAKYDCVAGLSGGTDSSYCVYVARQLGLRPLAVHFDNGWVTELARENIRKVVSALDLDLEVVRSDWDELRAYYRASLRASVPDICMPCMVGIASSLYKAAAEEKVGYILLGTSFRTEGLTPGRWSYIDGAYFDDVVRRHAHMPPAKRNFNRTRLSNLFRYIAFGRIRTVQLPLYIPYRDEDIRQTLARELGWQYGGKHHFDCEFKPLVAHVHARKFGIDLRKIPLAAKVRSGEIDREIALAALQAKPDPDQDAALKYCLDKLGLTPQEFESLMKEEPKSFLDYANYYSYLRPFGPLVKLACKYRLVPETAYERYFKLT